MRIQCPKCGKGGKANDSLAGKKIRCPACKEVFVAAKIEEEVPTFVPDVASAPVSVPVPTPATPPVVPKATAPQRAKPPRRPVTPTVLAVTPPPVAKRRFLPALIVAGLLVGLSVIGYLVYTQMLSSDHVADSPAAESKVSATATRDDLAGQNVVKMPSKPVLPEQVPAEKKVEEQLVDKTVPPSKIEVNTVPASPRLEEPKPGDADIPNEIRDSIVEEAKKQWPDNFRMQEHAVKRQMASYRALRKLTATDIPEATFATIKQEATKDHPTDYVMQEHSIKREMEAYRAIRDLSITDVPDATIAKIKEDASSDYPGSYVMQEHVVKQQVESWKKLHGTNDSTSSDNSVDRIYNASSIEQAMEEAKKFMVGTWTCTLTDIRPSICSKWVITGDGTMLDYTAVITDDDWGKPDSHKWKIVTGKFSDTGKRYYAFSVEGWLSTGVIHRDGSVRFGADATLMERGDKFPFSK